MNLRYYLGADYLFSTTGKFSYWYLYLVLFLAITIFGVVFRIIQSGKEDYKAKENFVKQAFWIYLFWGALGLASVFARSQGLPVFGARIFTLAIIKLFIISNIWLAIYYFKWTKKDVFKLANKKRKEKWLKRK